MKRLFLVVLLIFVNLSFAVTFDRPWEDPLWLAQNPYIFLSQFWWHLDTLHSTLNSSAVDSLSEDYEIYGAPAEYVSSAAKHFSDAENAYFVCTTDPTVSPHLMPLMARSGFAGAIFLFELMELFDKVSSCTAYKGHWIQTVDSALLSLELSIAEANDAVNSARISYQEVKHLGLCDPGYALMGSEHCTELESAFNSVDNDLQEGQYGKYARLGQEIRSLQDELRTPAPDMSKFHAAMGLIWSESGIIRSFTQLRNNANQAKNDAEAEYSITHDSALRKKSLVASELKRLEKEDIYLMDRAPSSHEIGTTGMISARFESLESQSGRLAQDIDEAHWLRTASHRQGYLANAILLVTATDQQYDELSSDIEELESDAKTALIQQQQEASVELETTGKFLERNMPSPEMFELYEKAKAAYSAGQSSPTLGGRFRKFSEAAVYARSARASIGLEETVQAAASLAELEDLIERAQTDEINVITEEETLRLVKGSTHSQLVFFVDSAKASIISKAKTKYTADLAEQRIRILDKLSLAGSGAADLSTDLSKYEGGIVDEDGILYPEAIGHLRRLSENYLLLETTLDEYMADIVGNTMSLGANPLVSDVHLDEPVDIVLDVVLTNPKPYGAQGAKVSVRMDDAIPFLYSDITTGKEHVESIMMNDKDHTVVLILSSVEPYESKRIILEKKSVVAHSLKHERTAEGIGNDAARISETIEFDLDMDVDRLSLSSGYASAQIDGSSLERPLVAGKHELVLEKIVENAYAETIDSITVYQTGLNSRVEYSIVIEPYTDLDSVRIFINAMNDSHVSALQVFAVTGQLVKEKQSLSPTQMSVKIMDLEKDKTAILKVSYIVQNTQDFVIAQLDQMQAQNLSQEAQELLSSAQLQAQGGDYASALEFIEKSKAAQTNAEKERAKLEKAFANLEKEFVFELAEIEEALFKNNISGALPDRLVTRRDELKSSLELAYTQPIEEAINTLEKLDSNWLGKEITAFRKDSYKAYNDLKQRFFDAGNSSTPDEFIVLETALMRLDTGGRVEYALEVLDALKNAEQVVLLQENQLTKEKNSLSASFESLKSEVLTTLDIYSREAAMAKGTEYSSLFTESESAVEKKITSASKALPGDPRIFWEKMADLNKSHGKMKDTLANLEQESQSKLFMLEALIGSSSLAGEERVRTEEKLSLIRKFIDSGEFVNALRASSALAKELESQTAEDDNSLLLLGLAALAVLLTLAVYIIKQQKEAGIKKPLKKLPKAEDSQESEKPQM